MDDIQREIVREIRQLEINCPDCADMYSDDQYTCTTCWCEGGQGMINVVQWLNDHPRALENEKHGGW